MIWFTHSRSCLWVRRCRGGWSTFPWCLCAQSWKDLQKDTQHKHICWRIHWSSGLSTPQWNMHILIDCIYQQRGFWEHSSRRGPCSRPSSLPGKKQNHCGRETYILKTLGLKIGKIIIQTCVRRGCSCLATKKREPLDVWVCVLTTKLTMMKSSSAICWRSFWATNAFFSAVKGMVSPALVISTLKITSEVKLIFAVGMHLLLRQVLLSWQVLHNVTTQTCNTMRWQKVRSGSKRRILVVGLL